MNRLLPILKGAPLWVWPLLALLLFLGIRSLPARRTRRQPAVLIGTENGSGDPRFPRPIAA